MVLDQRVRDRRISPHFVFFVLALVLSSCAQVAERMVIVEKNVTVVVKEPCTLACVPCQEITASPIKSDKCLRNITELDKCVINQTIHGKTTTWGAIHCNADEVATYWNNGVCSCERKVCNG